MSGVFRKGDLVQSVRGGPVMRVVSVAEDAAGETVVNTALADGRPAEVLTDESLISYGVGQTRYTQAARRARELNLWPAGKPLPVTLEEAVEGFQAALDGRRQTTKDERRRTKDES